MTVAGVAASPARARWERVTATPLVVLGVLFIVAYSVVILMPATSGPLWSTLVVTLVAAWAVFIVDVLVRIVLTPTGGRWSFVWHHPVDVLSALIPLFRALRVLELFRQVPYLRRRTGAAVRTNIIVFALSYSIVFVYFVALATLAAERDAPGATITSFGEAIWWAIVTIATVGYGDTYPITIPGRIYAVLLMAGGIAIVGTASATIISLINERIGSARRGHDEGPPADGTV
ncbi:potassium channel family protein [Agromyces laixinhei]|uniref:potassium channel family protein n=1 Tax=Agromyces laixinhei TaxID=2585717 RepID=UPI0012EDE22D|nr:potassium channel family protein [Agromyces laixinhei]